MNSNKMDWTAKTDKAIIEEIGAFIKHNRLIQNKTQAQVAKDAGINRWTLSQIENGEPITLNSLIQLLRVLNLLDILNGFTIQKQVSPIAMAKLEQQKRKRARGANSDNQNFDEW